MIINVSEIESLWSDNPTESSKIVYRIDLGDRYYDASIKGEILHKQSGMEAAVPLALLAGMRLNRPIHIKGSLSSTFLAGIKRVIDIYARDFPIFQPVTITADHIYQATAPTNTRKGSFFSGGVDSFYTLSKFKDKLTDLIYIYGFDVQLDDLSRRKAISKMGNSIATGFGMRFVEIEMNLGKVLRDFGDWAEHSHGFALCCIARSLANEISEITIPGTCTLEDQVPWGSSLSTDPNFSDEQMEIIHDCCAADRVDKVAHLVACEPLAIKYLRVCWERIEGRYNCCQCEKCLRTMVTIYGLGALDRAESFPLPIDTKLIKKVLITQPTMRSFSEENIKLLIQHNLEDTPIMRALVHHLHRPIWLASWQKKWRKRKLRMIRHYNKYILKQ